LYTAGKLRATVIIAQQTGTTVTANLKSALSAAIYNIAAEFSADRPKRVQYRKRNNNVSFMGSLILIAAATCAPRCCASFRITAQQ
jgi:hypothetical protein